MKDIIDRYEDSKFPALLEVLFFMILVMDLSLAVWMTFMAPLHITQLPYLKYFYFAIIPIAYIFPIATAICIKKTKKNLLRISTSYLILRVLYLGIVFFNETKYRMNIAPSLMDKEALSGMIRSGLFNITFTLAFSIAWIFIINRSKSIKYHIMN